MKITVNGKAHDLAQATHLKTLIDELCPDPKRVVAEINGSIIKRDHWQNTQVSDNDAIELVTFVGGG